MPRQNSFKMKVKYDLHIHSCLSPCGGEDMTPNNIAGMAMLGGLSVIALTDHNTSKNCPAFFEACRRLGIVPIPGMELTTAEDIHMVCLFPTLEAALEFDEFVDKNRMKIKNRPDIFGEQLIMNGDDEVIGKIEDLLIPATDLDIITAAREVFSRGGAAYPAHIEKPSSSIIAMLGDIPPEAGFFAAEVKDREKIPELCQNYPILKNMILVTDSDSHELDGLVGEPCELDISANSDSEEDIRRAVVAKLRGECR